MPKSVAFAVVRIQSTSHSSSCLSRQYRKIVKRQGVEFVHYNGLYYPVYVDDAWEEYYLVLGEGRDSWREALAGEKHEVQP